MEITDGRAVQEVGDGRQRSGFTPTPAAVPGHKRFCQTGDRACGSTPRIPSRPKGDFDDLTPGRSTAGRPMAWLRKPRWPPSPCACRAGRSAALLGGNPLVRTTDRVEALVMVLTVVVSLLAVPIAAAAGTAVHDSRRLVYAEQVQLATRSPRRSPTSLPPNKPCESARPPCRPDGLPAEPNTPARSRRNRQPKPATP